MPIAAAELSVPVKIGDFTDFFASIFHATNAGRMFRPDNPLMPNYKYVPVAYHSRASSVRVSGTPVRRPSGQTQARRGEHAPVYRPAGSLDYELELGFYIGTPSRARRAGADRRRPARMCSASACSTTGRRATSRPGNAQPLGPFLAKNFATTVSPFVVTAAALAPFRTAAFARPDGDPAPLPHLAAAADQAEGGLDIVMEALLLTAKMREAGAAPFRLSRGSFANVYWTVAQMVAHHTSNGCNLEIGDLMGSGTVSGPEPESWASLLELIQGGTRAASRCRTAKPALFLEDGDEVIFRAHCERTASPASASANAAPSSCRRCRTGAIKKPQPMAGALKGKRIVYGNVVSTGTSNDGTNDDGNASDGTSDDGGANGGANNGGSASGGANASGDGTHATPWRNARA